MKKSLFLLLFLAVALRSFAQPSITNLSFPSSVNLFDLLEVSFSVGNTYVNPYDPDTITITGLFIAPDNTTFNVDAFYFEDYTFRKEFIGNDYYEKVDDSLNHVGWRIRFTPTIVGNWRFRVIATDKNGTAVMPNHGIRNYEFVCNSVNNANGFISKANKRFLKRDVVENGQRHYRSFFPVGPNIAWYFCLNDQWDKPIGIYDYERRIDSLHGNANFMRVFLNNYQYLNLYGPEYTQQPIIFFDSLINQKDAAELDHIIEYAAQNGISVTLSFFNQSSFKSGYSPNKWANNPYHTVLGLQDPCDFFSDTRAKRITKNLIRYIVSRWGYATNVMCWELWNEFNNMFEMCNDCMEDLQQNAFKWHVEMCDYLRAIDPFNHCVSSSMGDMNYPHYTLYLSLFEHLDFVQQHKYTAIQNAKTAQQISKILLDTTVKSHTDYPSKPFFMGEFGFWQSSGPTYLDKDPCGVDLHNSLWSSLFSSSMGPGSFWKWTYLDNAGLYSRFKPILTFCQSLPMLSGSFEAFTTGHVSNHKLVFENNIETYYMKNNAEDTIYGWCQDTAFCYQGLRWLTDSVRPHTDSNGPGLFFVDNAVLDPYGYVYTLDPLKKPGPSFNSNSIEIPITTQPVGTTYHCYWYNSETGGKLTDAFGSQNIQSVLVLQHIDGTKYININFPSEIRDLVNHIINNTFGDAVFKIIQTNNNNVEN